LLTAAFLLTFGSMYLEWKLVHSTVPVLSAAIRWAYKDRFRAIVCSVALSVWLAGLFGILGLFGGVAGVLSSVLIQPIYQAEQSGKLDETSKLITDTLDAIKAKRQQFIHRGRQLKTVLTLLFLPFVVVFKVIGWIADRTPGLRNV
jgi:hypothetical protein